MGWPISRFEPCPMISSGCSLAIAARTASSTSFASRTLRVSTPSCSKPREFGESELAGMDMHAAEFGAAMKRRKHFAGVQQALRVERTFEPLLLVEIDIAKHLRHQVALFDAHAMFARQHAAKFDADPQDVGTKGFGALHFIGLIGIEKDERMQVAVAGIKNIGDAKIVFCGKIADSRQRLRQFAARNGAVHAEVVGRNPPNGGKSCLAPGPEQIAFGFGAGNLDGSRAAAFRDRLNAPDQFVYFDAWTIEFNNQQRLD